MLEGLQQLIDLQKFDAALGTAEREAAAIPQQKEALELDRSRAEATLVDAGEALQAAEAGQRAAETELQDKEALLAKLENQQHQVKSNDAYTALLHEMDAAKQAISACETRILEAMEAIESASGARDRAEKECQEVRARLEAAGRTLDARAAELEQAIGELRGRRDAQREGIDREYLAAYDRIATRHPPAVAQVVKEICQGCRVNIPPQLHIELLRGEKLIVCNNCRRILVPDAAPAARKGS